MKIDGRCHCGALAYEAIVDPGHVFLCHCEDCQSFSGAPFRVRVLASPERFTLTRGTPRTYEKVSESGARRAMSFCGECGTHVHAMDTENPSLPVSISGGTVRQKADLSPVAQFWCQSRLPWLSNLDGIRALDRQDFAGGGSHGEPDDRRDRDS